VTLRHRLALSTALCAALLTSTLRADEVILSNGDKVTGKIGNIAGGKMKFTSDSLGEITIDMEKVKSYTTDAPAEIRLKPKGEVKEKIASATTQEVTTQGGQKIATSDIKQINPPAEKWTGGVVVNGMLTNGNSHSETLGIDFAAALRRDHDDVDDRFSLAGGYHFGRQRDPSTGDSSTNVDDWFAQGKYDNYWTPQWYGYALFRVDHDQIANLNYRLAPGVGIGYQWIEQPTMNFSTEAGISYVYEDYSNDGTNEFLALRLAYHFDKKLNDVFSLFHNLEYLPAFEDPGDYILNVDGGVRAKISKSFFTEFKVEWRRDSTPAPGALKNDLRFLLGVGWAF
jgi:hypothetical protein